MSIPTRFCNQCGQEDHGSAGCHTTIKGIPQVSREMEKLVEHLDGILTTYQFKSTRYVPIAGWKHIIARIGKAYADGELELPGEEWRGPAEDMDSVALLAYDGIIIGLRKEEKK